MNLVKRSLASARDLVKIFYFFSSSRRFSPGSQEITVERLLVVICIYFNAHITLQVDKIQVVATFARGLAV